MAQLSIYNGSVTSGRTDGTLITTGDILKYTGETVSYTHLDVYKRQLQSFTPMAIISKC